MGATVAPASSGDIIIADDQCAGIVTLNRPRALNALTTAMRVAIAEAFPRWARDPAIYAVLINSTSDRAFCAGGDIRELSDWGKRGSPDVKTSSAEEYTLNWLLDCFTKPTISLINGIVMGSGVGISLYGTHRVAGERYNFAMPETAIGLFPDDGVCWAFARMPDHIGMYLGLTGRAIGRNDAYRLGLVTHCIDAARYGEIQAAIRTAEPVDPVLDGLHEDPGVGEIEALSPAIARCFGGTSVEEVITALRAERGPTASWAEGVLHDLGRRSPLSLKITHRHVRSARGLDLRATLMQDYRLVLRCLDGHDFYEGVRAALIDKDQAPKWQPQRLEDVTDAMLDSYFAPLEGDELNLASREVMQAFRR